MNYHVHDPFSVHMSKYYTVKKAAERVGKSASTIKRVLSAIKADADSPDRNLLLPTVEQYEKHKEDGSPFQWELSETLLQRRFPEAFNPTSTEKEKGSSEGMPSIDELKSINNDELVAALNRTIDTLGEQLTVKDTQLAAKDDQIKDKDKLIQQLGGMTESLQSKLLLLETANHKSNSNPTDATVVDSPADSNSSSEKGSAETPPKKEKKSARTKTPKPKKQAKSIFEKHTPSIHKVLTRLRQR